MVDNRYATALVISGVLSALATVYLAVAVGTQHWYQYSSPGVRGEANVSDLRSMHEEFKDGEFDEKMYSDTLFRLNGTLGLWWRCVLVPEGAHWHKEPQGRLLRFHPRLPPDSLRLTHLHQINGHICVSYLNSDYRVISDNKLVMEGRSFTLAQQFTPKYKQPGNHNSGEDMLRTCRPTYSIQNNVLN